MSSITVHVHVHVGYTLKQVFIYHTCFSGLMMTLWMPITVTLIFLCNYLYVFYNIMFCLLLLRLEKVRLFKLIVLVLNVPRWCHLVLLLLARGSVAHM